MNKIFKLSRINLTYSLVVIVGILVINEFSKALSPQDEFYDLQSSIAATMNEAFPTRYEITLAGDLESRTDPCLLDRILVDSLSLRFCGYTYMNTSWSNDVIAPILKSFELLELFSSADFLSLELLLGEETFIFSRENIESVSTKTVKSFAREYMCNGMIYYDVYFLEEFPTLQTI